ncbi:uncharacterized protein LOC123308587 [Coccinella septempunctata]|uniref:uncharacterized protein LOC123308587 n=1 Tax=Coccinella septempunctata TaxID=41139 RepID=UPI001D077B58|nr:uncharacterized protein LOC123308587 [Coccinella septempunctata]
MIIKSIKHKIQNLSDELFHKKNFDEQTLFLMRNGYPKSLIHKIFYSSNVEPPPHTLNNVDESHNNVRVCKLIYVPRLSEQLKRLMKDSTNRVIYYYNKTVRSIFSKLKDRDPKERCSGVVYKINCRDCSVCYVGQTGQYLGNRSAQHERDCKNKKESTALSAHASSSNHNFDFQNVEILGRENNWFKRCFKEMIYIKKFPNTVNARTDVSTLSVAYSNLIPKC